MRIMNLGIFIAIFFVSGLVHAHAVTSAIDQKAGPEFEGYHYNLYAFERESLIKGFVAVLSKSFDAYLFLITPNRDILTNDDHAGIVKRDELPELNSRDAALMFDEKQPIGSWYAIATTLGKQSGGEYTLIYEGIRNLRKISEDAIDHKQIEDAFQKRGVLSETERYRREEEARRAKIDDLVEQLSLSSYRRELKRKLEDSIRRQTEEFEESRRKRDELKQRIRDLEAALENANKLGSSQKIVRELVEKELKSVQFNQERKTTAATESFGKREAFVSALDILNRLDNIATELARAEATLLGAIDTKVMNSAQESVQRLKDELGKLSAEIAEKLLDSDVVYRLGFNRFRTYWERLAEYNGRSKGPRATMLGYSAERIIRHSAGFAASFSEFASSARISRMGPPKIDTSVWLPSLLPWPPPDASARAVIGPEYFTKHIGANVTLGDIDRALTGALVKTGYYGSSYFGVPRGFAIVTRIEQTDGYGLPLKDKARWSATIEPIKSFSLIGYIRALLTSPPGHFRVLALIVSSEPFSSSGDRMRIDTIERWSRTGFNVLPMEVKELPYTEAYRVTVLVYEFEKLSDREHPNVSIPGSLSAATHLKNMEFSSYLL
jgi:hypothetical protein